MGRAPWAILDFPGPDGFPTRQLFRDPVEVIDVRSADGVRPALGRVESLARSGLTMVGFVAYDAAPGLEPKFAVREGYDGPLVYFLAGRPEQSNSEHVPGRAGDMLREDWSPDFTAERYRKNVAAIIEGIGRGDYYQVNLTERFSATIENPLAVYERIRSAQMAQYSAYIETADMAVLSVSPELFVHRAGNVIESRPMKGTARRGRWPDEDDALARELSASEKERAENVMIVDLIRNDMGRIAAPGTVAVPAMFTVERYPTVLQMTSHVKSQVPATTTLADVFAALFPCGSVTGAPKIAASKMIRESESTARGVYCGAVGVVRPGGTEFTFNVAIRTAVVSRIDGRAIYGAGGGITADSQPERELAELKAKAAVLTSMPREVELLETLRLDGGHVARLDGHVQRLARSAAYFGFWNVPGIESRMREAIEAEAARNPAGVFRLRVVVSGNGSLTAAALPHAPDASPRRVGLASTPVQSSEPRLYHKVTDRTPYSDRLAEVEDVDDVILVNERGELTETTIGNLVLELDGRRVTPALHCGLLPGVFRATLLATGDIEEGILYPDDLRRASRIWMINSVREWVQCELR